MYVFGSGTQKTLVEVIGFDKVHEKLRQVAKLKKVSLVGMSIKEDDAEIDSKLHKIAPNVQELDIAGNLFNSWSQVVDIIQKMKNLVELNISENKISVDAFLEDAHPRSLTLKVLFANRINITSDQIVDLLDFVPNLSELHACFNGIQSITNRQTAQLHSLRLLNLEGNKLEWNEVMKLSSLKSLETLILNNNRISKIYLSTQDENMGFKALASISISGNEVSEWTSVNKLALLPTLSKVKFKLNPLCKGKTTFDLRQELIARLGRVVVVNGGEVTTRERNECELLYMKKYCQLWLECGGIDNDLNGEKLSQQFQELHPRFLELIRCHGPPVLSVQKGKTLKDKLIILQFKCPDLDENKIIEKKVPITMTLQQLKSLLQRLFKIQASKQQVSYLDSKTHKEVKMDDNLRDLEFYSITKNDIVLVRS
ncbi:tubulin-specific chaperone E-like isoform X2 [Rhopilema esculentum]